MQMFQLFRRLCCGGPPPARPTFNVLCLGLGGSGKSSLLAKVSGESTDAIEPTVGGDNVRPYWNRYYGGSQGVIFVVDSSADSSTMDKCLAAFDEALSHPELDGLPLLVLANFQDKPRARREDEVVNLLNLGNLTRPWAIQGCMLQDKDSIVKGFDTYNKMLLAQGRNTGDFDKI
ncbi:ARL15-like protein [Mya arenaria]|uniref:ARL15-like protein n=1 Tax=Mya arenaria TaxID=6604 RepID=A0ABY7DX05_MYAAR|nr:ARL15-like protein [Mya arenaria]